MTSKAYLTDYAHYNQWANQQMIDLFQAQPESLLNQTLVSSFPSVKATFVHLLNVEWIWLERLKGNGPTQLKFKDSDLDNKAVFQALAAISAEVVHFVVNHEEGFFDAPVGFSLLATPNQKDHQTPRAMLHHLFNHQTSHRGQLITLGRQLGITEFPRTDYMVWARDFGQV